MNSPCLLVVGLKNAESLGRRSHDAPNGITRVEDQDRSGSEGPAVSGRDAVVFAQEHGISASVLDDRFHPVVGEREDLRSGGSNRVAATPHTVRDLWRSGHGLHQSWQDSPDEFVFDRVRLVPGPERNIDFDFVVAYGSEGEDWIELNSTAIADDRAQVGVRSRSVRQTFKVPHDARAGHGRQIDIGPVAIL